MLVQVSRLLLAAEQAKEFVNKVARQQVTLETIKRMRRIEREREGEYLNQVS